jgi:glycosyltransferase involved in cell wall biosynthesis
MNILYIAVKVPYPIHQDGGTLINYNLLKGLKKNHTIDFITFVEDNIPQGFVEKLCHNYYGVAKNNNLKTIHYLKGALGQLPPFYYNMSEDFLFKLKTLISTNNYHLVFTDSIYMDVYSSQVVHPNKIISLHDSLSLLYKSFSANTSNILSKIYFEFCAYVYKKKEMQVLYSYSKSIFVSCKDEKYLRGKNESISNTCSIPNGVNAALINRKDFLNAEPNTIVFSGIMDYKPNADAAIYFAREIFPLILEQNNKTKFFIVGKNPTDAVKSLANKNIVVTGWVDDVSEYITKGVVYVSPLVSGAGLKNKILEAMALRRAIVATSISIDGLKVADRVHLYVADSPDIFAKRVIELLNSEEQRNAFIAKAFNLIQNHYTWSEVLKKYEEEISLSRLNS